MGTILGKSALDALKIEVFKKKIYIEESGVASLRGACNKAGSPKTSSNLCVFNFIRNFSEVFPWRYGGKFWWNWKRTGLNLFWDYLPCYVRHPKMRHLSPASGQKKSFISKNSLETKEIFQLNEPFKSDLDCWKYYVASMVIWIVEFSSGGYKIRKIFA